MSAMNRQQREAQNAAEFRRNLLILHQAAVGVVLCRTREPYRAIEAIRDLAFTQTLTLPGQAAPAHYEFRVWSLLRGWSRYSREAPLQDPVDDNIVDPFMALRAINGVGGQTESFPEPGFYVMFYPHFMLSKHPGMMQCLKEYCRMFATVRKRLVLLTPPTFELPPELEDDIAILDFDAPSYSELGGIYEKIIGAIPAARRPNFSADDRDRVLAAGGGMTAHEFENALSRAMIVQRARLPHVSADAIVEGVMKVKTEVVKRSEVLEVMEADSMENVGGLDNLKTWVAKRARCFSQDAADFGIKAPKGIALIGPPGTGKSLAAKSIASTLGLPLIKFDVSRVFNSLVGSSEGRVRAALKMVNGMAPCVLMIDEADKAFQANSGGGDSGVGQRVLGAILTWMQETPAPVFVVVTANRVNNLPSEFLRRGRLDEIFSVSVPNPDERLEIIAIHLRKRLKDPAEVADLAEAVAKSSGYVPAEIEAAVNDAVIDAFTDDADLDGALIARQLDNMVPLSIAFAEDFAMMQQWAENNARPASAGGQAPGVRARTRTRTRPAVPSTGARAFSLDEG